MKELINFDAKQAQNMSDKHKKIFDNNELNCLLKKIWDSSRTGSYELYYEKSISDEVIVELKNRGFRIKKTFLDGFFDDFFIISWYPKRDYVETLLKSLRIINFTHKTK